MRLSIFPPLIFLVLFIFPSAIPRVVELHDNDIDEFLNKNNIVMVLFYAVWCGHCNKFKPTFERTSIKIMEQGKPYSLAQIEMVKEVRTKEKYSINSYPILKLFVYGKVFEYDGEKDSDSIIAFIDKKTSPPTTFISSLEEIDKIKKQRGLRVFYIIIIQDISAF